MSTIRIDRSGVFKMIDNIKIVAADIDMTLTSKGDGLPQVTKDAFEVLHRNGVKIGLGTGREINDKLRHQGKDWGLSFEFDFVVGMNGGMVLDHDHNDRYWETDMLSREEMKDILEYMLPLVDKYRIGVNCEGNENHNAMYIQGELLESSRRHGFEFVDCTGDVERFCERPTFKFLFRTEAEHEAEVREYFLKKYADKYQIVGTFPGTVEVMHKGIDKGSGLEKYAQWNDIVMENVIAFGDNENDDTMLEYAGWGVCLKDGAEGTKKYANALTDYDCLNGGVGHYLFDHYIAPKGLH